MTEEYEENKEMNAEYYKENKERDEYRTTWPVECSWCLYRDREYVDEIGDYVECIHPIFSRKSYECPVRMTAMAKKRFGRTALDDYI